MRDVVLSLRSIVFSLALVAAVSCLPATTLAQAAGSDDGKPTYQPVTTADPAIPPDELELLLRPLTRDELKGESDAWLGLLKAKVQAISEAELAAKRKREGAKATTDEAIDEKLVDLRSEQTGLVERTNAVLAALKEKGGDETSYKTYIQAVSGLSSAGGDVKSLEAYIIGWLKSPEGGIAWAKRLGLAILILFIGWVLSKFAGRSAGKAMSLHPGMSDLLQDFVKKMAGRLVMLIGLLVAISALDVEIGPMLAALGAGGFILAFALQESIGNFAAGLMIMFYRPFDTGDFVDVDGVSGTVQRVTLASTHLMTPDNKLVILPNNKVLSGVITNNNGSTTRRVDMTFGIGYDDNIGQAVSILEQLTDRHPLVLKDPAPTVKVHDLADSSVNLICRPWVESGDYWAVRWDLTRSVKERFDEEGISIPYPQQDVHVHPTDAGSNGSDPGQLRM